MLAGREVFALVLEEAAHVKRVVGMCFGQNSTDVLFTNGHQRTSSNGQ